MTSSGSKRLKNKCNGQESWRLTKSPVRCIKGPRHEELCRSPRNMRSLLLEKCLSYSHTPVFVYICIIFILLLTTTTSKRAKYQLISTDLDLRVQYTNPPLCYCHPWRHLFHTHRRSGRPIGDALSYFLVSCWLKRHCHCITKILIFFRQIEILLLGRVKLTLVIQFIISYSA